VPNQVTMPGATCVSCHMVKTDIDGTNSLMYKGHTWSNFIKEPDGTTVASCSSCHPDMLVTGAQALVEVWKQEYNTLDSIADAKVTAADTVVLAGTDTTKVRYLAEAHFNLQYAESDESGGFHNHKYLVALLNDAASKANFVVTGVMINNAPGLPKRFALDQNYPNPFNPTTTIRYELPTSCNVSLRVYNILGQEVVTLVDEFQTAGFKSVRFSGAGLATGIYIYTLKAGSFVAAKKLLLLK